MIKSKKSMELSMNLIIIAAIALIVLIVLILILTGQMGKTRLALNKTSSTYSGEKCVVPGTSRQCRIMASQCSDAGGIDYGKLDCTVGVCCSE